MTSIVVAAIAGVGGVILGFLVRSGVLRNLASRLAHRPRPRDVEELREHTLVLAGTRRSPHTAVRRAARPPDSSPKDLVSFAALSPAPVMTRSRVRGAAAPIILDRSFQAQYDRAHGILDPEGHA
jgi:hypothetical protein